MFCKGAVPELTVLNTLILTLSRTCPGIFSSVAGTWSGVINLSPSIAISSAKIPLAVPYAPSIVFGATLLPVVLATNDPPEMFVSTKLTSVIVTEPSLSTVRKINVSPAFSCKYNESVSGLIKSIVEVTPSPTKLGITA